MEPTVRCSAKCLILSPFIARLLSLVAPRVVIWDNIPANSNWAAAFAFKAY